mmetsp:Transcript_129048/g.373408  ORF Transcript_129048/g.373408 Transcript_129048/m.373408 type:complete len:415 (+) Transcript_129048:494-1738(+)
MAWPGGDTVIDPLRTGDAILDVAAGVKATGVETAVVCAVCARDVVAGVKLATVVADETVLGVATEHALTELGNLPCNKANARSASCTVRPVSALVCTTWPRIRRACSVSLLCKSMSSMAIQLQTHGWRSSQSQISASRLPSLTSLVQSKIGVIKRRASMLLIMCTLPESLRQVLVSTIAAPVFFTMRSSKLQHVSRNTSSPYNECNTPSMSRKMTLSGFDGFFARGGEACRRLVSCLRGCASVDGVALGRCFSCCRSCCFSSCFSGGAVNAFCCWSVRCISRMTLAVTFSLKEATSWRTATMRARMSFSMAAIRLSNFSMQDFSTLELAEDVSEPCRSRRRPELRFSLADWSSSFITVCIMSCWSRCCSPLPWVNVGPSRVCTRSQISSTSKRRPSSDWVRNKLSIVTCCVSNR